MLKVVRITAIVVFAIVVAFSAHSLSRMYSNGRLFDDYNSQRKSSITLLAVSILALFSLGSFELSQSRKSSRPRDYGGRDYRKDEANRLEGQDPSSIYAAPKTVDAWKGKRIVSSGNRRHRPVRELHETWMVLLRIACSVLPLVYIGVFGFLYMHGIGGSLEKWVYPTLCSMLILIAVLTAIGVFRRKTWGLSMGYLLSILNLVIFPIGTAMGLLLLIGLVGATPAFSSPSTRRRGRIRSMA